MNIFKGIRLGIWSIILAACVVIGGLYLAVSQTFLTTQSLNRIVAESQLSETVRSDVLLPKILQTTRASDYAALLDDNTVTAAFNEAVSTEVLNKKLEPAVDSLQKWLNSKEPTVDFSISMADVSDSFAEKLANKVNDKYASIPSCTLRSTLADAESGICRSSLVTKEALAQKINDMVKQDASLQSSTTITPDSIQLSGSLQRIGSDLPTYLNMFYAGSIIAAGIAALISLWLLLKHRLSGIIAFGSAGVLSGLVLYIVSVVGTQRAGLLSSDSQVLQVARAGSNAIEAVLQQQTLLLVGVGALLIVLAIIAKIILKRRASPAQSLHLSNTQK